MQADARHSVPALSVHLQRVFLPTVSATAMKRPFLTCNLRRQHSFCAALIGGAPSAVIRRFLSKIPCVSKQRPSRWCLENRQGSVSRQGSKDTSYPLRELRWMRLTPARDHLNNVQRLVSGGLVSRHGLLDTVKKQMEIRNKSGNTSANPGKQSRFPFQSSFRIVLPQYGWYRFLFWCGASMEQPELVLKFLTVLGAPLILAARLETLELRKPWPATQTQA